MGVERAAGPVRDRVAEGHDGARGRFRLDVDGFQPPERRESGHKRTAPLVSGGVSAPVDASIGRSVGPGVLTRSHIRAGNVEAYGQILLLEHGDADRIAPDAASRREVHAFVLVERNRSIGSRGEQGSLDSCADGCTADLDGLGAEGVVQPDPYRVARHRDPRHETHRGIGKAVLGACLLRSAPRGHPRGSSGRSPVPILPAGIWPGGEHEEQSAHEAGSAAGQSRDLHDSAPCLTVAPDVPRPAVP